MRFAEELQQASRLYAALLSSEHEYWDGYGSTAKDNLDTLSRLGLEQYRPMLLSVLQHFDAAQQKRVLKETVSWSVRGLISGGIGKGSTEKAYCNAAVNIRSGAIKNVSQLRTELAPVIASDLEFREAFRKAKVTKGRAGSAGGCNELCELLRWCHKAERLAWPSVEAALYAA